jgi:hypothetical protein
MPKKSTTPAEILEPETKPLTLAERKARESEVTQSVARFQMFQGAIRGTASMMKLARYFAGLEIQTLRDLHSDLFGETRGGDHSGAEMTLEDWLEDKLQVTARTASRHFAFFSTVAMHHPEIAEKLNVWWTKNRAECLNDGPAKPAKPTKRKTKAKATPAALALLPAPAMQSLYIEAAAVLQDLLGVEDDTDIASFFEVPMKSAGGDDASTPAAEPPSKKHKLIQAWHDFQRRALAKEYLRLPKDELEALQVTTREMHEQIAETLAKKAAAKKAA